MKTQFYFYYKEGGTKHISGIRKCKYPRRTKIYKQLLNSLNRGFVEVIGCGPIDE